MPEELNLVTISISGVPKKLLKELERLARETHRNRSQFIVKTLDEAVYEARETKPKAA